MQTECIKKYFVSSLSIVILLGSSIVFALTAADGIQSRIIGGKPAQEGAWPWIVGLLRSSVSDPFQAQFCGGTLIRSRWVLTAAHCVTDDSGVSLKPQDLDILGGVTDLDDPGGQRVGVLRIIIHPQFDVDRFVSDIALIELESPLTADTVRLPGLTFDEFLYNEGVESTALGWGTLENDPNLSFPNTLRQVSLPVVSNELCQSVWGDVASIKDTMLCAGPKEGGKDTCVGDSGGPIVTKHNSKSGEWTQIGVTSFGAADACAAPDNYGVYTRVSRYSVWISQNVCQADEQPGAPSIGLTLADNLATVAFDPIVTAEGYRLYWAPHPEMTPISQLDMGNQTSISASLPWGTELFVAIEPYNRNCLGLFSNIEALILPSQ